MNVLDLLYGPLACDARRAASLEIDAQVTRPRRNQSYRRARSSPRFQIYGRTYYDE